MSLPIRAEAGVYWPNSSVPGLGIPMRTALSTCFIKIRQFQGANSFHPCLLMVRIRSILSDMVCTSDAYNVYFDSDAGTGFYSSSWLFWKGEERGQVSKLRFSYYILGFSTGTGRHGLLNWVGWNRCCVSNPRIASAVLSALGHPVQRSLPRTVGARCFENLFPAQLVAF